VQFFQRFPAFRKESVFPIVFPKLKKIKRTLVPRLAGSNTNNHHHDTYPENNASTLPTPPMAFAALFLHVIRLCHERIQLQHYVNFAKRRRVRIRYAGQGGTTNEKQPTGEQIVSFPFPERVSCAPLQIRAIHGILRNVKILTIRGYIVHTDIVRLRRRIIRYTYPHVTIFIIYIYIRGACMRHFIFFHCLFFICIVVIPCMYAYEDCFYIA
jgi:hypothetical protein